MNILKHMESIFVVTLGIAAAAAFTTSDTQAARNTQAAMASDVPVVVISAKRMTAQEKLQSLNEERRLATNPANPRSSI